MNRSLVFDLATAAFIGKREDALFLGPGILSPIWSLGDRLCSATGKREPVQAEREGGFQPVRGYERFAAGRPRQVLTRARPGTGKTRDHRVTPTRNVGFRPDGRET